jgi:thymidylate kinase
VKFPEMSMSQRERNRVVRIISFSGIDGGGKTTQIRLLRSRLQQRGLRVRVFAFWDDVATLTWMRENTCHAIFKGDKGVGTPAAPKNRRDKNVRSPLLTCVRLCLCLLDVVSLLWLMRKVKRSDVDCVIFDRYIYDQFANLNLQNPVVRACVRAIMLLVPRPEVAFLLDADPFQARERKPEYPIEFLIQARAAYFLLHDLMGGFTIVPPMPPEAVGDQVFAHAADDLRSQCAWPVLGVDPIPNRETG